MLSSHKQKISIGLKKARGLLETAEKMMNEDRYCLDVAQQINAAIGVLRGANGQILESHLLTCGAKNLNSSTKEKKLEFVQELLRVFGVTLKK